jgi:probable phosphoglycerate mutase
MIYLLRHGLDDERFIGGHSDVDLIEEGVLQIEKSAMYIKDNLNIRGIISSDVKRCVTSSNIVNEILDSSVLVKLDSSLRELDKGILTGCDRSLLTKCEKEILNRGNTDINFCYPNGESMIDLYNRINLLVNDGYFLDKDCFLLVTHRGVINMLYFIFNNEKLMLNKEKFMVEHGSIHELDITNKKIKRIY